LIRHAGIFLALLACGLIIVHGVYTLIVRTLRTYPFRHAIAFFVGILVAGFLSGLIALLATDFWPRAGWPLWIPIGLLLGLVVVLALRGVVKQTPGS
jgi:hypothetical protein